MLWVETRTPQEAKEVYERTWGIQCKDTARGVEFSVRGDGLYENAEFWAHAIQKVRDNPHERLKMPKRHLPLPAAFREAAVALRAIIRSSRKEKISYDGALEELYRLAGFWSFYVPYAPRLQQAGYTC